MKATELRIGNYVMNLEGEIDRITGISDPVIATEKIPGDIDVWVEPIPLTEEWLLKFGFRKRNIFYILNDIWDYEIKDDYRIEVHFKENRDEFYLKLGDGDNKSFWGYYKYVHQLQNLYFALNGEELEIKTN